VSADSTKTHATWLWPVQACSLPWCDRVCRHVTSHVPTVWRHKARHDLHLAGRKQRVCRLVKHINCKHNGTSDGTSDGTSLPLHCITQSITSRAPRNVVRVVGHVSWITQTLWNDMIGNDIWYDMIRYDMIWFFLLQLGFQPVAVVSELVCK